MEQQNDRHITTEKNEQGACGIGESNQYTQKWKEGAGANSEWGDANGNQGNQANRNPTLGAGYFECPHVESDECNVGQQLDCNFQRGILHVVHGYKVINTEDQPDPAAGSIGVNTFCGSL